MRALLEFLGLPVEDTDFIKRWCNDHMLLSVPGIGAAQQLRSVQTEVAFSRYIDAFIAARQQAPASGRRVVRVASRTNRSRTTVGRERTNALVEQLLFAGHETTTAG